MLSFLISLLSFAFIITVLVFIHELGHYLAARSVGMRVEKFSVGFPPRFLSFTSSSGGWDFKLFFYRKNKEGKLEWLPVFNSFISRPNKKGSGTEYCLALLPLGGYVKVSGILDESMDPNSTGADYEYQSKKTWQKLWFTSAGVIFNFILAFIILAFSYMYSGYPTNKIEYVFEDFENIELQNIKINDENLDKEDSFMKNIVYQSILDTTFKDSINGFLKYEKSKGNLRLRNLAEKDIEKISFNLPSKINRIDSIVNKEHLKDFKITHNGSYVEVRSINESKKLSSPVIDLGTIYHDTIDYSKSPAFQAGLKKGDRIISINDKKVKYAIDIQNILSGDEKKLNFEILSRSGNTQLVGIDPHILVEYNHYQDQEYKRRIGVGFDTEKLGFFESFFRSGYDTFNSKEFGIKTTFKNIFYLITGRLSLDLMSGPVGIAKVSGDVASSGDGWFLSLLQLMAFLSISLGVINILPFPGLDGGHALIAVIEKIKGSKLSAQVQVRIQQVGMLMLMSLFVYIIFKDFMKILF